MMKPPVPTAWVLSFAGSLAPFWLWSRHTWPAIEALHTRRMVVVIGDTWVGSGSKSLPFSCEPVFALTTHGADWTDWPQERPAVPTVVLIEKTTFFCDFTGAMPQALTFWPVPAVHPALLGPFTVMIALEFSPLVLALVIVGVPLIVNCDGTRIDTELMLDDDCLGDVFVTVTAKF